MDEIFEISDVNKYLAKSEDFITDKNIKTIMPKTFYKSSVKSVHLTKNVTTLGEYAFKDCNNLKKVKIDSLKAIEKATFQNCFNLKEVILPKNLSCIDEFAFSGCSKLENITLPDTVREIGGYAFSYTGLKSIVIPEGVEVVDKHSFLGCENLENITLPKSLKKIDYGAFSNCANLKYIELPEGLEEIGSYTFTVNPGMTPALKQVHIPKSVKKIAPSAFDKNITIFVSEEQMTLNPYLKYESGCILNKSLDDIINAMLNDGSCKLSEINKIIIDKEK